MMNNLMINECKYWISLILQMNFKNVKRKMIKINDEICDRNDKKWIDTEIRNKNWLINSKLRKIRWDYDKLYK